MSITNKTQSYNSTILFNKEFIEPLNYWKDRLLPGIPTSSMRTLETPYHVHLLNASCNTTFRTDTPDTRTMASPQKRWNFSPLPFESIEIYLGANDIYRSYMTWDHATLVAVGKNHQLNFIQLDTEDQTSSIQTHYLPSGVSIHALQWNKIFEKILLGAEFRSHKQAVRFALMDVETETFSNLHTISETQQQPNRLSLSWRNANEACLIHERSVIHIDVRQKHPANPHSSLSIQPESAVVSSTWKHNLLAISSVSSGVLIFDMRKPDTPYSHYQHLSPEGSLETAQSLSWHPSSELLASGGMGNHELKICSFTQQTLKTFAVGHGISSLAWFDDATLITGASYWEQHRANPMTQPHYPLQRIYHVTSDCLHLIHEHSYTGLMDTLQIVKDPQEATFATLTTSYQVNEKGFVDGALEFFKVERIVESKKPSLRFHDFSVR